MNNDKRPNLICRKKEQKTAFFPYKIRCIGKFFVPLHPNFSPLILKESYFKDSIQ